MLGFFPGENAQHGSCWALSMGKKPGMDHAGLFPCGKQPSMDHAGLFPYGKSPAWIMWGLFRKQKETHIIRIMRDMLGFSTPHMSHAWFFPCRDRRSDEDNALCLYASFWLRQYFPLAVAAFEHLQLRQSSIDRSHGERASHHSRPEQLHRSLGFSDSWRTSWPPQAIRKLWCP
jgi:hypothetical protein